VATAKGRRLIQACSERLDPIMITAFAALSTQDKRALHQLLRKLIASMSDAETEARRSA
jgi:hypothetical protein